MAEDQRNRSQVKTLAQPPAGRLVPQVVPVQVNVGEVPAVHAAVRARARRRHAVREQDDRFPGRPYGALIFAVPAATAEARPSGAMVTTA